MAVAVPNGSIVAIASGYGAVKQMTAVTNANPGAATLEASHGVSTGDFIEVTSGWSRLNGKIVKAGTVATNTVPLTGIDTTSTTIYPAGAGVGSVRDITGFTQIAQIVTIATSGGDQQFVNYQFLEDDSEKRIPSTKSASGLQMDIGDDTSLAGYAILLAANNDRLPRAVKITLPNGSIIVYNAYISLNQTPSLSVNQINTVKATLSFLNEPVRY